MPVLHIFRGLPGSGKTTAARKLAEETGAILIEPDALLVRDREYDYCCPECYEDAVCVAQDLTETISKWGADIIYADVLPRKADVFDLVDHVRASYFYEFVVHDLKITAEESKRRNRHDVRHEDIDRMAKEWEDWE